MKKVMSWEEFQEWCNTLTEKKKEWLKKSPLDLDEGLKKGFISKEEYEELAKLIENLNR